MHERSMYYLQLPDADDSVPSTVSSDDEALHNRRLTSTMDRLFTSLKTLQSDVVTGNSGNNLDFSTYSAFIDAGALLQGIERSLLGCELLRRMRMLRREQQQQLLEAGAAASHSHGGHTPDPKPPLVAALFFEDRATAAGKQTKLMMLSVPGDVMSQEEAEDKWLCLPGSGGIPRVKLGIF